jgi:hypothetical protein
MGGPLKTALDEECIEMCHQRGYHPSVACDWIISNALAEARVNANYQKAVTRLIECSIGGTLARPLHECYLKECRDRGYDALAAANWIMDNVSLEWITTPTDAGEPK